ncbi:MAG: hypothetical protein H7Y12_13390 [Sphingobacteriaceae bacterium]|nr:hypothetical protein [Cytophagaceae bacterium]
MKKVLLFLLALGLITAGYLAWRYWSGSERSARAYIPTDALLVVESTELQSPPDRTLPHQVQLADVPVLGAAAEQLRSLHLALSDTGLVNGFLRGKTITYSLHSEGRDLISYLLCVPASPATDAAFTERLQKLVGHGVRAYRHTFDGIQINDVVDPQSQPLFSYLLYDNYLILSRSSQLVENVVRKINRLVNTQALARERETLLSGGTRLYFDRERLAAFWASVYTLPTGEVSTAQLLPGRPDFQFRINDLRTNVMAESIAPASEAPVALEALIDQEAQPIGCARLVPNHTAVFYHLSVSDPARLRDQFRKALPAELRTQRDQLADAYRVEVDSLYAYLSGEVALCQLESSSLGRGGRVLIVKTSNVRACADWLDYQAARIQVEDKQPRYEESVQTGQIRQINAPELPSLWFGSLANGFPKSSFFTTLGDYLVVGSDVPSLRTFVGDYVSGNVWSKSARPQELLRQARPAQFTAVAIVGKSWFGWNDRVQRNWRNAVGRSEEPLRRLDLWLWQSRFQENSLYTTLTGMKGGGGSNPNVLRRLFLQKSVPLRRPLLMPPFVLRAGAWGGGDVFGQSTDRQLMQLNSANDSLRVSLDEPLVTEPLAVDYYGNGDQQYLLLTATRYHLLDRKGQRYELSSSNRFAPIPAGKYSVLGYVSGDRQQLTLADTEGHLFVLFKNERIIRGMNALPPDAHVIAPVQSVQLNRKPHLIFAQEVGKLNVVGANGANLRPFPVDLKVRFGGPVFLETGTRQSDLLIQTVSVQGELVKVNLSGEVVERRQLFRANKETEFTLLLEKTGRDWLVTSVTGNTIGIHDQQGKLLFQVDNADPYTTRIEYYDFGAEVKILSVATGKGTWLYNLQGQPLVERPLSSTFPVVVQYAESYNKLFLFATTDKALQVWTVKIR